jgi:hypothetical protein
MCETQKEVKKEKPKEENSDYSWKGSNKHHNFLLES